MGERPMGEGNGWDEHKRLVEYRLDELKVGQQGMVTAINELRDAFYSRKDYVDKELNCINGKVNRIKAWAAGVSAGVSTTAVALWNYFGG